MMFERRVGQHRAHALGLGWRRERVLAAHEDEGRHVDPRQEGRGIGSIAQPPQRASDCSRRLTLDQLSHVSHHLGPRGACGIAEQFRQHLSGHTRRALALHQLQHRLPRGARLFGVGAGLRVREHERPAA